MTIFRQVGTLYYSQHKTLMTGCWGSSHRMKTTSN